MTAPRKAIVAVAAAVAVLVFAVPGWAVAAADRANPFVGRWHWDGPETCAVSYEGDNVAMEIKPRQLVFYENTCAIASMRKLGESSYRLQLTCRGEGETERQDVIIALLPKSKIDDELLLRIEPKSGFVLGYRRCA